jgi:hypothetical protein
MHKGCASYKCPPSNLFQPDAQNCSRQPRAMTECPFLDHPDSVGYINEFEGPAVGKCILPNLFQPIVNNLKG